MPEVFDGVVGIDLGTTYSCVGVFLNGQVHIVPNDQGNRITPSRIAILGNAGGGVETLVGDAAMNLSAAGAKNVIYDAKRLIGRSYQEVVAQGDAAKWPFSIKESPSGAVLMVAETKVGGETFTREWEPEEVSAIVLKYLKECAERFLGKTVSKAVITVPAYFNNAQRERTKAAGRIAGFEVERIINEPTAAALAFGIGSPQTIPSGSSGARNVLVFDFGGGTFDVSVISIEYGAFEVRSTAGDTYLGGQDIDKSLMDFVMETIQTRYKRNLAEKPRAVAKLRLRCEKAKRALTFATSETIDVSDLLGGDDDDDDTPKTVVVTRAKLDDLNNGLYKKCMAIVKKALDDCKGISKADIHEVVMVGGSSRIPRLQKAVSEFFGGKELCHGVNPDEAVAVGAAIQGSILSTLPEQKGPETDGLVLMDVISISIGVDVDNGKFDILIPRNTTIPFNASKEFTTVFNNQETVDINVYEGERPLVKHNHLLGAFCLSGITKAKRGAVDIAVTFDVDANGQLTVSAEERLKGKRAGAQGTKNSLVVENSHRLSDADIQRMIDKAAENYQADNDEVAVKEAVQGLQMALDDVCTELFAIDDVLRPPNTEPVTVENLIQSPPTYLPEKLRTRVSSLAHPKKWLLERATSAEKLDAIQSKVTKMHALLNKAAKSAKKVKAKAIKKHKAGAKRHRSDDDEEDDEEDEGSTSGNSESE